jgi:hypothetical protein
MPPRGGTFTIEIAPRKPRKAPSVISPTRKHLRGAALTVALALAVGGAAAHNGVQAQDPGSVATSVVPVTPFRILDTRNGIGTGGATTPVGPGATIDLQVAGVGTVPADAVGVILNITGTNTSDPTYVTAWPTGDARPEASVLNLTPGIDAPNGVTALLGDNGRVSLFNFTGSTHLLADVAAYLVPSGSGGGVGPVGPAGPAGPIGPAGPAGISGFQIVSVNGQVDDGDFTGAVNVACPAGKTAIGGGAHGVLHGIAVEESRPFGLGWRTVFGVTGDLGADGNRAFVAYAVCAVVTS